MNEFCESSQRAMTFSLSFYTWNEVKRMIFAAGLVAVPYLAGIASTMSSSVSPLVRY